MLKKLVSLIVFVLLSSTPLYAMDFIAGLGIAYPFKSNRGHVTTNESVAFEFTQYFAKADWGAIGIREALWTFPSLDYGIAGGIGPAGELRYHAAQDVTIFLDASGSIGASNLDGRCPEITGTVQFGGQVGLGLELADHVRVELRYSHLSNGGTSLPNAGLDMIAPVISWKF